MTPGRGWSGTKGVRPRKVFDMNYLINDRTEGCGLVLDSPTRRKVWEVTNDWFDSLPIRVQEDIKLIRIAPVPFHRNYERLQVRVVLHERKYSNVDLNLKDREPETMFPPDILTMEEEDIRRFRSELTRILKAQYTSENKSVNELQREICLLVGVLGDAS